MKVLAFTINHPFESKNAIDNINRVISRLNLEYFNYTPDFLIYKKIMKTGFLDSKNRRTNKTPCLVCTAFMQMIALNFAYKMGIPFVLYCSDPLQIAQLDTKVNKILSILIDVCGKSIVGKVFEDIVKILSDKKQIGIPTLVFPFVALGYDKEKIISELQMLDLYSNKPSETHCSLRTLLDYYSFKNYDCPFYAIENAMDVRNGKVKRAEELKFIKKYRDIILNIASKKEISTKEKRYIKDVLNKHAFKQQYENTYENIIKLNDIAKELGIEISEIGE